MGESWMYGALILFSTFISAISQVMLKKAAMKTWGSRLREYLNAPVICAYVIFVAAAVMTVWAYRGIEVSRGTLLETSSYLFIFAFDVVLFRERMTLKKMIGTALIMGGILITVFC